MMTALRAKFVHYLGPGTADDMWVDECLAEATAMVEAYIDGRTVSDAVKERAICEAGSELFHRKNSPQGIAQMSDGNGSPIRLARDPMIAARAVLHTELIRGLA